MSCAQGATKAARDVSGFRAKNFASLSSMVMGPLKARRRGGARKKFDGRDGGIREVLRVMKELRIGIVGAGAIVCARHAPGLSRIGGVGIAAVANSTPASAQAFCEHFAPGAEVEPGWESLVGRDDLDIVWIGAGPFLHEPVTLAALRAGRHVFCQARMAGDLAAACRMLEAARARPDLVTMLCPPPHGLLADAFVKSLLDDHIVGEIRTVRLRSLGAAFLDPTQPPHWRQRTEISGKNILSLGIHTEVIQRWLGPFTPTDAMGRIFTPERGGVRIRIPDQLVVLADFESGAQGVLEFSAVHAGPPVEVLEIGGTTGVLEVDFATDRIVRRGAGKGAVEELAIPPEVARPWRVEADFIDAVRNPSGPRPHPDFEDGVAYMEVVERVWEMLGD
jgi:predicted dehydrogenase